MIFHLRQSFTDPTNSSMDSHVVYSSSNTAEETPRPEATKVETTHDQIISPKVTQKRAGQKPQQEPEQELLASKEEWKVGRNEWLIVIVLAIVSLMVALDATILVTALPVRAVKRVFQQQARVNLYPGYCERSSW